jgi:hypothetical protein
MEAEAVSCAVAVTVLARANNTVIAIEGLDMQRLAVFMPLKRARRRHLGKRLAES